MIQAQRRSWDINMIDRHLGPQSPRLQEDMCWCPFLGFVDSTRTSPSVRDECSETLSPESTRKRKRYAHRSLPNATRRCFRSHTIVKDRNKRCPKCADAQVTMEMHRMLRNRSYCVHQKQQGDTAFNLVLDSKGHGKPPRRHKGKILTKGVVSQAQKKAVATVS